MALRTPTVSFCVLILKTRARIWLTANSSGRMRLDPRRLMSLSPIYGSPYWFIGMCFPNAGRR